MELFRANTKWKIMLMIIGAAILVISIIYSNHLAHKLLVNEQRNISLYKKAVDGLIAANDISSESELDEQYLNLLTSIVDSFPLPVIYQDEKGKLEGLNFNEKNNNDSIFLQNKIQSFLNKGLTPIQFTGYASNIYYFNSSVIDQLKLFPIIQLSLIALYIALGYFLFNTSKREEESRIWAGMAKETAHQLGTPISAILGWVEYLKMKYEQDPENAEVLQELSKDVSRLELVADRFSKIGSDPVLVTEDVFTVLDEVKSYLQRRAARKVVFQFKLPSEPIYAPMNRHLFSWVIENLLRNALDAMPEQGTIKCIVYIHNKNVVIELSDTGHGIPSNRFKEVFKPGYSTKKRGWGLGLSLSKRIIEEYHKGKIFVKSSIPNQETTFSIELPLV